MIEELNVHDLLRITPVAVRALSEIAPFAGSFLEQYPFVVVRRARCEGDLIPVGIRGRNRQERCAAWIRSEDILARVTPESLRTSGSRTHVAAFAALSSLRTRWHDQPLIWGPTGSVGFALASGWCGVHAGSDLDIAIRANAPLSPDLLHWIADADRHLPCAVDIQIETPWGAFSPREYSRNPERLLLRTVDGPRLSACPWLPTSDAELR